MNLRRICTRSIAAYMTLAAGAHADTFVWDPNLDNGVTAGSGTWELATPKWFGAPGGLWPNQTAADADIALFAGTGTGPFTVNLGAPIVANGLTFDVTGYTIGNGGVSANTLTLDGTLPTITITNADHTAVIGAEIAGAGGFAKEGAGTLTLSGVNTYGGVTAVNSGTLEFSSNGNLGAAASGVSISNNAVLRFTGSTMESLAARPITIGFGGGTINHAGTGQLTASSVITAPAGNTFTKTGSGTLLLLGNSPGWAGDIAVNEGTLQVGNAAGTQYINGIGASTPSRVITVNSGAVLDFLGRDATGNTPAAFVINGGTVRNTAGFTRMGNLTLDGGTIHVVAGNSATYQAMTFNGDVTVIGATPSQITSAGGTFGGIHLEKSGGVNIAVPDITGDASPDFSIATPLLNTTNTSTANGFIKSGAGTLRLTGANTFTGSMIINDGRVIVDTANTANAPVQFGTAAGTNPNLTTNVALRVGNITQAVAGSPGLIDGTGTLALNAERTFTINDNAAALDLVIAVPITNGDATGRGVIKTGTGTVLFNAANTFSGTFTINDGTVILNANNTNTAGSLLMSNQAGGSGHLFINSGVTYRLSGNPQVNAAGNGAFIEGPGTVGLFNNRPFTIFDGPAADDLTVSATIADGDATARQLRKEQTGRMVMAGANTYTGTTEIYRGTLVLDYSTNTGSKLMDTGTGTAGATNLRGGILEFKGNSDANVTEIVPQFGVVSGPGTVQITPVNGKVFTFNMDDIARGNGQGLANFVTPDAALGRFQTTSVNTVHGILGSWATFNGNRFATVNGGFVEAAASTVQSNRSQWQPAQNVVIDGSVTGLLANAVNSLIFDAATANTLAIDNSAGAFVVRSGGVLVSANVGTNNTVIAGGRLTAEPYNTSGSGEFVFTNRSNGTLTLSSAIAPGNAPLSTNQHATFGGDGLIEVTGRNFYTGTSNIQGRVRIAGGNALNDFGTLTIGAGAGATANGGSVLNLDGSSEAVGSLTGGAFSSQGAGEIQLGTGGALTIHQTAAGTYNGFLTGSGSLVKKANGTLTFSVNPQAFTGTVQILGGLMDFNSGTTTVGGATGVTAFLLRGGSMLSAQTAGSSMDKWGNSAVIQLEGTTGNGLRMSGDQNGTRTESVDKLEINAGANILTITNTNGAPTAAITTMAFTNATDAFSRANNATLLARSGVADFGGTSTAQTNRITFASGITGDLVGGGGAAGSTSVSILPFAIGGVSGVANPGDTFVTVGANGLRPLAIATEFATTYSTAAAIDNLSQNATIGDLATKTVNSLRVDNSAANVDLTGAAASSLTLTSGALLVSAGANLNDTIIGGFDQVLAGAADTTPDELVVHITSSNAAPAGATLTMGSAIANNGAAPTSLTKSGDGVLILNAANSYTGATTVNQGVLQFSDASQLGGEGTIRLAGGTLQWGGANVADISTKGDLSPRTVELLGPSPFLSPAGAGNILNAGNRIDVGANNVSLAYPIGNGGVGSLSKLGAGTLTLSSAPTYLGPTVVREGTLNLPTIAPNTSSALWLVADSGTVASNVTSGLNVQSLIVGAVYAGTANSTGTLTVGGGVVNIGDGSNDDFLLVGYRDAGAGTGAGGTTRGTADFSATSAVNINVARVILGQNPNAGGNNIDGNLILSNGTNTVTANLFVVGNSLGPGNTGTGVASSVELGTGLSVFNVDSLTVGGAKTDATMILGGGGVFKLRGTQGGTSAANLFIGDNDIVGTGTVPSASNTRLDVSAGTADIKANLLVIARHASGAGQGGGTLTFGAGQVEAETVQMAITDFRGGDTATDGNTVANINQMGGAFRFGEMSKGLGNASYNWNAGTFANAAGSNAVNQNVPVNLLGVEPHLLDVETGRTMTFQANAGFSGAGTFFKVGAGTLALEGASTMSGAVSIEDGKVLANNATGSALGTSDINVSLFGTLGGSGSVAGAVTVNAGGTIAPGASIESLATGALTMAGGSTLALEINTSGVPSSDLLDVSGPLFLELATSPALTIADLGSGITLGVGTTLPFINYAGTWNGGLFAIGGNPISDDVESFQIGSNRFTIDYDLNGNTVALVAVPEPGTGAILLGGLASLFAARRRRQAVR